MRIEDLRAEKREHSQRVTATVIWEDCDRPRRDVYFEVDEAFAQDLDCNPHAFLAGSIVPAMRHGEQRITIPEAICPEFHNGLINALGWICSWYGPPRKQVRIEAKPGIRWPLTRSSERAGLFLSGGVDSLASIRLNRLDFPLDHPRSVKDGLIVHGFDVAGLETKGGELEFFQRVMAALKPIAADAKVQLLPVFTNIRYLDDDVQFWMYEFVGAGLAAVAHALAPRLSAALIASTIDIANMSPEGTHPVLDPNYGSADLRIAHDAVRLTRLEKVRLLADWDVALDNLRVCTWNPPDGLNCGKCEKCIRTMLELLVLGKLLAARSFAADDVSPQLLASMTINTKYEDAWYKELVGPLKAIGRFDLIEVIDDKTADFSRRLAWKEERDWKGAVKRFDRRYLGGDLFRTYKTMRSRVKS